MRLRHSLLLLFGLLIVGEKVNAFNVCRSVGACDPTSQCCSTNCMPLLRTDCDSCTPPPCRCHKGTCTSVNKQSSWSGDRSPEVGRQEKVEVKKGGVKWPDILLIACFAIVIAVSLASGMLWAYLTFRDTRRLQQDDALRKEDHRRGARTSSQGSLKGGPVRRVSSKSSKEVVKA